MCSEMHGQSAALDEALVASFYRARVWSLVGMDPVVPTEVGLAVEGLSALLVRFALLAGRLEKELIVLS
jgi:hypothetical protein